jgi:acyl-CoA synthetase (NDP forming)
VELEGRRRGVSRAKGPPGADLIRRARSRGACSLTEPEAKALLRAYGIPVVEGRVVATVEEALAAADMLGYPVVLKGIVPETLHKTERGLVALGIADEYALRASFAALRERAEGSTEGVLVERMIAGRRELVVGVTRDRQFGSVLMFGVGGVLTEALADVAFAVPPLDDREAGDLIAAIHSQGMLGPFRGELAADRSALVAVLEAVSRLALDHPEIQDIDVNPLILAGGLPVAVDAAVTLGEPSVPGIPRPPRNIANLAAVLNPQSLAIVGASNDPIRWGGAILTNIISGGFAGRLYPVALRAETVFGLPAYPSISALPEAPDLAVIAVPVSQVKGIVDECGRKGVRAVVVISAGFSELGDEGGVLQRDVAEIAARYGMAMIGPNGMGVVSSWSHLYAVGAAHVHTEPSPASIVSQSGNAGVQLMVSAQRRGAGLGKFVSIGNEGLFATPDLLDYFRDDPETGVVGAYIEGFEDGRALLESARRLTARKPFLVLRGGASELGRRAAASHTGAMAAAQRVFEGVARQAGMITTFDPDDFLDLILAFSYLPLPRGRRVAVITMGGGWGVLSADEVERSGMELASFTPDVMAVLDHELPHFWSHGNPVDLVATVAEGAVERVVEAVIGCEAVDALIVSGVVSVMSLMEGLLREAHRLEGQGLVQLSHEEVIDPRTFHERQQAFVSKMVDLMNSSGKPILSVSAVPWQQTVYKGHGDLAGHRRVVVVSSPVRAVRIMAAMAGYAEDRARRA